MISEVERERKRREAEAEAMWRASNPSRAEVAEQARQARNAAELAEIRAEMRRRLADPTVSDAEKDQIRFGLRAEGKTLAERVEMAQQVISPAKQARALDLQVQLMERWNPVARQVKEERELAETRAAMTQLYDQMKAARDRAAAARGAMDYGGFDPEAA